MKNFYVVTSLTYKDEDPKMCPVMLLDDEDIDRIKETYDLEKILLESNPNLEVKVDILQSTVDSLTVALNDLNKSLKKEGE